MTSLPNKPAASYSACTSGQILHLAACMRLLLIILHPPPLPETLLYKSSAIRSVIMKGVQRPLGGRLRSCYERGRGLRSTARTVFKAMFAFNTRRRVAAVIRGRSVYHFKPFNTITGDAEPKLPSEDSIAGQVIKLKRVKEAILLSVEIMLTGCQDHEVHKLQIEHLTKKVDKGFVDMKDGFKRTDSWMMLLISAVRSFIEKAIYRVTDKYAMRVYPQGADPQLFRWTDSFMRGRRASLVIGGSSITSHGSPQEKTSHHCHNIGTMSQGIQGVVTSECGRVEQVFDPLFKQQGTFNMDPESGEPRYLQKILQSEHYGVYQSMRKHSWNVVRKMLRTGNFLMDDQHMEGLLSDIAGLEKQLVNH
ncbi:hypothetical protein FPQ18DRAFT_309216 [Pyronema domesticum]|nr:hypothetical protein FPQ18DRAFT_309216 [Pyronema domesticum]